MKTIQVQFKNRLFTKQLLIYFVAAKNAKKLIFCGILLFSASGIQATTYYGKNNSAPNLTTSWGVNSVGGGTNPTNFTTTGDEFIIQTGITMTANGVWTIGPSTGFLRLEIRSGGSLNMGNNTLTLTNCNASFFGNVSGSTFIGINGTLDLGSGSHSFTSFSQSGGNINGGTSTLNISASATIPKALFNAQSSTINFNGTGAQTVPPLNYYNLIISGVRTDSVTLDQGTISIAGTFTPSATFNSGKKYKIKYNTIDFNGGNQNAPLFPYYNLSFSGNGSIKTFSNELTPNFLKVNSSVTLVFSGINKMTPVRAEIYGTVKISGDATFVKGTQTIAFQNNSFFVCEGNELNIPTATWANNSTCVISASIKKNSDPIFFDQSFGNLTWDNRGQTDDIQLKGNLRTINGDFKIISTGYPISKVLSLGSNKSESLTIGGNFEQTDGIFYCYGLGGIGNPDPTGIKIKIAGNFTLIKGTFVLADVPKVLVIVNIGGNFTHTGGTITENSGRTNGSNINFTASTSDHIYKSGGTISNYINFVVNDDATLCMGTPENPSIISGSKGSFTLQSGSWLRVTSPAGITAHDGLKVNPTLAGNIQVTGSRSYSSGSIHYMGNVPQVTGDGLTEAVNLLITNNVETIFTVRADIFGDIEIHPISPITNLGDDFRHTATSLTLGFTHQDFFPTTYITNVHGGLNAQDDDLLVQHEDFFNQQTTGVIVLKEACQGNTRNTYTWIGGSDVNQDGDEDGEGEDWHTPENWCIKIDNVPIYSVPTKTSDVIIPVNNKKPQPVIKRGTAECNNILIYPTASVKIKGTHSFNVYGNFVDNGRFETDAGTVTINGTLRIGNATFFGNTGKLILNNTSSISKALNDEDCFKYSFTNNGSFNPGTGQVILNGNVEQSIGGEKPSRFYNLVSAGTGLKVLTDVTKVDESLTIEPFTAIALSYDKIRYPNSTLNVKNLIFCKTSINSAEFYRNDRILTIDVDGKVSTKVKFDTIGKWHFIAFPYEVKAIKRSSDGFDAVNGTGLTTGDYSLAEYDAAVRATNKSGWKNSKDKPSDAINPMQAGKGYIINKKNKMEDLFFDGIITGTDAIFDDSRNYQLTYSTGSPWITSNFGWNFKAHPLTVTGKPALENGQFAYGYEPSNDTYKLWYGEYNKGYEYRDTTGLKPFEAYFLKTYSASATDLLFTSTMTQRQGIRAYKTPVAALEEVITLNLNVANVRYNTLVRILDLATAAYDDRYDAPYNTPMLTTTPRIYTLIGSNLYALNSVPTQSTVPVGIRIPQPGTYSFSWDASAMTVPLSLTDKLTGKTTDMQLDNSYKFTAETAGDINSRFVINVAQKVISELINDIYTEYRVIGKEKSIRVEGLSELTKITLYEPCGKIVNKLEVPAGTVNIDVPQTGVYIVELSNTSNSYRTKVICK